jgi:hypothetical protein
VLILRRCINTALNALPSKTGDAEVTVAGFKALSFHLLGKLRQAGIRIMCLYHCASLCGAQCVSPLHDGLTAGMRSRPV